jgi:hypothetical protein
LKHKHLALTQSHEATESGRHFRVRLLRVLVPWCEYVFWLRRKAALGHSCLSWFRSTQKREVAGKCAECAQKCANRAVLWSEMVKKRAFYAFARAGPLSVTGFSIRKSGLDAGNKLRIEPGWFRVCSGGSLRVPSSISVTAFQPAGRRLGYWPVGARR